MMYNLDERAVFDRRPGKLGMRQKTPIFIPLFSDASTFCFRGIYSLNIQVNIFFSKGEVWPPVPDNEKPRRCYARNLLKTSSL